MDGAAGKIWRDTVALVLPSAVIRLLIPRLRLWAVGPLLALLLFPATWTAGSMYACRDASGSLQFTNVPGNPTCRPYTLSRDGGFSSSRYSPPIPHNYDRAIRRIASRYDVDPPLIKAIIHTESDFDHRAVSKKGALGLMQLMPETARELRVADPFDPLQNIDGGTRYFRFLLNNFNNDLILSLAAYNAGPGLVERTGGVPAIAETRRYINKVLKQYRLYRSAF